MIARVRCYRPNQQNLKLCARATRSKTDRATNCSISTKPLKTMGLDTPNDDNFDALDSLLEALLPNQLTL